MSKKRMLALGAIAATTLPVVSVVSCSFFDVKKKDFKKNLPKTANISGDSLNLKTKKYTPVVSNIKIPNSIESSINYDQERKSLEKFTISDERGNQDIGYLPDIKKDPIRNMKVYDNGLFKIKIDKKLIGPNKFFGTYDMAAKEAKAIVETINFGPAITHLKHGIQILSSSSTSSLGGQVGVQVALINRKNGLSTTEENLYSLASLVAHEYGHHETLWDFTNFFPEKDISSATKYILKNNGLDSAAKFISNSEHPLNFIEVDNTNWPEDYAESSKAAHPEVFDNYKYPFGGAEIATRVLNMMSGTTKGMPNVFSVKTDSSGRFTEPAFLISYATMKYYAKDAIFGKGGKDNSHIKSIFNAWLKEIMGYGQKTIGITIKYNDIGMPISGITLADFGGEISKLIIKDSLGKILKTIKIKSFNGLFGYKNELLAKTQKHKLVIPISSSEETFSDINGIGKKIYAYNSKNEEVDLSKFKLTSYSNDGVWEKSALKHEYTHLVIEK